MEVSCAVLAVKLTSEGVSMGGLVSMLSLTLTRLAGKGTLICWFSAVNSRTSFSGHWMVGGMSSVKRRSR